MPIHSGDILRFAPRVEGTARRAGRPKRARPLLRSAWDHLGLQAKPAVKSEATSPSRAGSLTPHRVHWWCGARLALCIIHSGSPILQTPMHAAFIVKTDPLGGHRIRLRQGLKDLIPPTFLFEQTVSGFDVRILVGSRHRNAFVSYS